MNYEKIYYDLVLDAKLYPKKSDYHEKHHILPKSMGGTDDGYNLVKFTARQHYIAHWLLYKIHRNWKMAEAWRMMTVLSPDHTRYTSHTFELARKTAIKHRIGQKRSAETKRKIGLKSKGRKPNKETRNKISASLKNRVFTAEHCKRIQEKNKTSDWKLTKIDKESPTNKVVYQYDLEMNFIKEYMSGRHAHLETGASINGISLCCNAKQNTSGGYIWKFKED